MKWKNAVRDHLPPVSCEVLVSIAGVYHIALFNKEANEFRVRTEGTVKAFRGSDDQVYWQAIPQPGTKKKDRFKVLIADDDVDDHVTLKAALEACGAMIQVDSVYDGDQVVDYLLRKGVYKDAGTYPDLILLDINMPRMDGFQVLDMMSKHAELKSIPVYVISTSRDTDHLEKALRLGARGFHSKGSSHSDTKKSLKDICAQYFNLSSPSDEE